uniref:Uncharacterized protein n=1 Tax=Anguilla anguilla TaxID=7936 RepID=A0A0E9R643_ANGAN
MHYTNAIHYMSSRSETKLCSTIQFSWVVDLTKKS